MIAEKLMVLIAQKNSEGSDDRLGNMSISDVPYCARKTAYKLHNYAPTNRPNAPGAMEIGTVIHEAVQAWCADIFGEDFHSVEKEVVVPVDYHDPRTDRMERAFIKGHCDGALKDAVVDFKTYRGVAWKYRTPLKPNYYDQLQLYMRGLGMSRGVIVHICKDDLGMDETEVGYDEHRVEQLIGKMADILGAESPEEFKRVPEFKWECSYCQYKDLCKGVCGG